ncbi:MAG: serine hydrolase domain-containing protein [Pseudomonadota bacterium]
MKRLYFILRALLLAFLVAGIVFYIQLPRSEEAALSRIDRLARNTTADGHWPAISIAFVAPGEILWQRSYGSADIANARPMTPETPMPIGSISKVIIGLTAAEEARADRFDLDAPLSDHWPDLPPQLGAASFRQLGNHSSGLRDSARGYDLAAYAQNTLTHPEPLRDYLENYLFEGGSHFEPDTVGVTPAGATYAYSNVGAALAADILARAANTDFAALSQRNALTPLGLSATWDATTLDNRAKLYEARGGTFEALPPYALATWPDGGLNASLSDLAKLLATLMADGSYQGIELLAPETVQILKEVPSADEGVSSGIGTSLFAGERFDRADGLFWAYERWELPLLTLEVEGHSGGDPGLVTMMYRVAATDRGFVIMVNGLKEDTWSLLQAARLLTLIKRAALLSPS